MSYMGQKKGGAAKMDALFTQFAAQLKAMMDNKVPVGEPITVDHWRATHPEGVMCASDSYYAAMAQKIQERLSEFSIPKEFPDNLYRSIAIAVTAYMEDKRSGLGVWAAFQQLYHERYGKGWLPFFDTEHDDYFTDDLNIEDVKYIVWQVCSRVNQSREIVYSPFSQMMERISPVIYDILVENFNSAPEAEPIRRFILSGLKSNDYLRVRPVAYWLVARNPLISVPGKEASIVKGGEELSDTFAVRDITSDRNIAAYTARSWAAWSEYTGPLGCSAALYMAKMAETERFAEAAESLRSVKKLMFRDFAVVDSDKNYLYVDDVARDRYNVLKASFAKGFTFHGVKGLLTQIVRYGQDWNVNGICICLQEAPQYKDNNIVPGDTGIVLEKVDELISKHDGRQLLFCKNWAQLQKALGGSKDSMPMPENVADENFVVYLSRENGVGVWPDMAQCFNAPGNRLFRKHRAADESLAILSKNVPDDIVDYIVNNHLLSEAEMYTSQGGDLGRRIVQENLGFLIRFYRTPAADNDGPQEEFDIEKTF